MNELIKIAKSSSMVYIQMHNNPDPDAVASALGMQSILDLEGIPSQLIYFGPLIKKPNLRLMVSSLNIPLVNINKDFTLDNNDLLIVIDAQYREGNLFKIESKKVACIDHHNTEFNANSEKNNYVFKNIQPQLGSCSTLICSYFMDGNVEMDTRTATALYFGLMVDTDNFNTKYTNQDREVREYLEKLIDKKMINKFVRSTISFEDREIIIEAFRQLKRDNNLAYSHVGDCDDNLLGHISDIISEIEGIDIVILYSERDIGYKLSIRSYLDDVSAEEIIAQLTYKIGSGGGHVNKAGGFIRKDLYETNYPETTFELYIINEAINFTRTISFLDISVDNPLEKYSPKHFVNIENRPHSVRYLEVGTHFDLTKGEVEVKTITDNYKVGENIIIVINTHGDVTPLTEKEFNMRYTRTDDTVMSQVNLHKYGIKLSNDTKEKYITNRTVSNLPMANARTDVTYKAKKITGYTKVKRKFRDTLLRGKGYLVVIESDDYYLTNNIDFERSFTIV